MKKAKKKTAKKISKKPSAKKANGFAWPNNARVCVVMTCLWENWSWTRSGTS